MAYIILADDDELVTEIAATPLREDGHIVGVVHSGADAWKAILQKRPDLVILDCNMPEANGLLVLREMRLRPDLASTPVLILTGRRSQSDVDLAMFEGATDYMKKPFDPDELAFRVSEILKLNSTAPARTTPVRR